MELAGLEAEIKKLIIETLMLEDVTPEEIVSGDPLFGEGLGLDSIDALELALAIEGRYGVTVQEDAEQNQQIFLSVRSLAEFVEAHRVS
ncbi:MAG: phosphopantetheine-binding protein [Myxococcota bacterium]|nr:phosphopantetheine-binding protein [Myxococcota bacterium]